MKGEREIMHLVRAVGLECSSIRTSGGNHIKARIRAQDGREQDFFFSTSPSDRRHLANNRSMLRRFKAGISIK